MTIRYLLVVATMMMTGCALQFEKSPTYNEEWSKAKNMVHSAGMHKQMHDQQLPVGAYDKEGNLQEHKLGNISHPAYGSGSGVVGVNIRPYGAFERFYWGWTVPGASHYSEHRLFAWMPDEMADDESKAREKMEVMLSRASLAILEEMGYRSQAFKKPFELDELHFKQWYLEQPGGACSFARLNCVLSLYVPEPEAVSQAPFFSYYSIAGQPSWFFASHDNDNYPRLAISQGEGMKSISENVFYQKLSARLPGWVYFYLAPDEVGTGDNNRTIAYPYVLEKGMPLLFIRPAH
ncbi:hypothetical protein NX722_17595 [Endozoicomonas gorgoniicola]|uniref:Lipoprotein n=1 Tax=Endozoicomonas gorgoniicola TaxID=1234144 RepID=A0ABT3MYF3_9GAMM|nr:hypothetical protein [Endozoicomonas gorgoniicola]MCW7554401.1 hypothetical protein [Endozoicomonas gorgoniicola]